MTAKIYAFPSGKIIPIKETANVKVISKRIINDQTRKYGDALTDDIIIQMIGTLQKEGLDIGKDIGDKTFLDVGIFLECFRALIYRELDLPHPFHYITDNLMFLEKSGTKKYSVANYSGTKIVKQQPIKLKTKEDDTIEFESEMNLDDTD